MSAYQSHADGLGSYLFAMLTLDKSILAENIYSSIDLYSSQSYFHLMRVVCTCCIGMPHLR